MGKYFYYFCFCSVTHAIYVSEKNQAVHSLRVTLVPPTVTGVCFSDWTTFAVSVTAASSLVGWNKMAGGRAARLNQTSWSGNLDCCVFLLLPAEKTVFTDPVLLCSRRCQNGGFPAERRSGGDFRETGKVSKSQRPCRCFEQLASVLISPWFAL